jgi:gamma-glutamyltranspeptidase/glutathione hydrolase
VEHGTVYLTAGDREGMLVSFIQSNYRAFGSGAVVPHTGISLQCLGAGFVTTLGHPYSVAGGKRPYQQRGSLEAVSRKSLMTIQKRRLI